MDFVLSPLITKHLAPSNLFPDHKRRLESKIEIDTDKQGRLCSGTLKASQRGKEKDHEQLPRIC